MLSGDGVFKLEAELSGNRVLLPAVLGGHRVLLPVDSSIRNAMPSWPLPMVPVRGEMVATFYGCLQAASLDGASNSKNT